MPPDIVLLESSEMPTRFLSCAIVQAGRTVLATTRSHRDAAVALLRDKTKSERKSS